MYLNDIFLCGILAKDPATTFQDNGAASSGHGPGNLPYQIFQLEQALAAQPDAFFGDSDQRPLRYPFGDGVFQRSP